MIASAVPLRSEALRRRIVQTLSHRLDSDVTLEDLSLRVFPRFHAHASGLKIRQRGRTDVPPLISVDAFEVHGDAIGLWRKHVSSVRLSGLVISIPPDMDEDKDKGKDAEAQQRDEAQHDARRGPAALDSAVIDTLDTEHAQLVIVPRKADKRPKVWAIHNLRMHNVSGYQSMPFRATLTNAVPPGEIETAGNFGPWNREHPGRTPLNGTFTFDKADLSVFKGIGGTLSAHGKFGGRLDWIEVDGNTNTPDFLVEVGGHPVPLQAKYRTVVDGTNGDTRLERIDARFLESTIIASGAVLDGPKGEHGRTVSLDISMPQARIEDVMTLAVHTQKPVMTGALQLSSKFLLPPGETDVSQRLRLDGRFAIAAAMFTNYDVQGKIIELSHRGRGKKPDERKGNVASDFAGRFRLMDGLLELPEVAFRVPGAQVRLTGRYALKPETLDFSGTMLMDAKVSETVTGWKSLLLKVADPLFSKRGGGSAIPIRIEGTRNEPKFGLDVRRVFRRQ